MEELTLDQIKKKSDLEKDIDFENGDLPYFNLIFSFVKYIFETSAVI